MLNMIKRDSTIVKTIAEREMLVHATCQISRIMRKGSYTNIALQKITFIINNKEYHMDHIWLQQRDYCRHFKDMAVEGKWYNIDFVFYQYRDRIDRNADGIMMHGINVLDAWNLKDKNIIEANEEVFSHVKHNRFTKF